MKSKSAEDSATSNKPSQDPVSNGGLRKGFSSTPDLKTTTNVPLIPLEELKVKIGVKTSVSGAKTDLDLNQIHHVHQDDGKVGDQRGYFTLPGRRSKKLPPPDHAPPPPPPPPPPTEVMLVKSPEKTSPTKNTSPIMSSFKPDDPQTQPQSG